MQKRRVKKRQGPGSWLHRMILIMLGIFSLLIGCVYAQHNLIVNPSVEQGSASPDNWTSGGTGTSWASRGHNGLKSLLIDVSSAEGNWRCSVFNVTGNGKSYFGFWVNGSVSSTFYVYLRFWSDYGGINFITQIPFPILLGSYMEWKNVNETITAPSNALSADVYITSNSGTGSLYFDDFFYDPIEDPANPVVQWFGELFYGTGKWLTLTIMLAIIIVVSALNAYGGILFLPITIFLSLDYFAHVSASSDFMWGAIVMMFSSIYIFLMLGRKIRK